jgi:hypothetical protein
LSQFLADAAFEARPTLFNLIQVWGIGREVEQLTASISNQFLNAPTFMEGGIVQNNHLSWFEYRQQTTVQPRLKYCSITSTLNGKRGEQFSLTQCGYHVYPTLTPS